MNAADRPVPVTILTGFLGSGKTTLLNHILKERHGHRIAVIENEFGEVDVDSDLVLTSDEEIFQMSNGCICCVADVRTDLVRILEKLFASGVPFDHILVETSGLADPQPVAATFFMDDAVARQVRLDAIVTLVDAAHIETHLDDPRLTGHDNQAVDQIVSADRVVLNKIDLVDEPRLVHLERRIGALNEGAAILRSSHAKVDLARILGIGGFAPTPLSVSDPHFLADDDHVCGEACDHDPDHAHAHAHPHARGHAHDPSVDSVSLVFEDAPFERDALWAWLRAHADRHGDDLFRLKGILAIAGDERRHVLQGVHRILELRPAEAWGRERPRSKLVFIGRGLDRRVLQAALQGCLAETAVAGAP
jgi:G3E family GTPase